MKLIITCEVKQTSQSSLRSRLDAPWDWDSEHLSVAALAEIESALCMLGHQVQIVQDHDTLLAISRRQEEFLCVNLSVGYGGPSTKVFTAALLDILGMRYLGSPPHSLAITRDKSISKAIAQWLGIPTPRWHVVHPGTTVPSEIEFPVIVKPLHESSSIGIHPTSVIHDARRLNEAVSRILAVYRQPAIIEQFISGFDLEVPFLGFNEIIGFACVLPRLALPKCDILTSTTVYKDAYDFADVSGLASWSRETERELKSWISKFANATGIRDYGRADFRIATTGEVYFIEASTHPYVARHSSFAWLYERTGRQYKDMWDDLLTACLHRYQQKSIGLNMTKLPAHGS